jgi:hypothetical protein
MPQPRAGNQARLFNAAAAAALVLGIPGLAFGATADQGRFGPILFGLAVLVVAAKIGGLLVQRWGQPSVLGELLVEIGLRNLLPEQGCARSGEGDPGARQGP